MGFLNELISVRYKLREAYIALVKKYGNNGELDTFNICSKHRLRLEGNTIHKIKVIDDCIMFYYNKNNPPSYNYFICFDLETLASFYDKLAGILAIKKEQHNEALQVLNEVPMCVYA